MRCVLNYTDLSPSCRYDFTRHASTNGRHLVAGFVSLFLAGFSLAFSTQPAVAANPRLVADIHLAETLVSHMHSSSFESAVLRSKLIFTLDDTAHGRELWVSDGTEGGASLLADIFPGPEDSSPQDLVLFDQDLYFTATSLEGGKELWLTDGTSAGTRQVVDSLPGNRSVYPSQLAASDNLLFFACSTFEGGSELCVYDGRTITQLDVVPGTGGLEPLDVTSVGDDYACFSGETDAAGREPWCSDGTLGGTKMIGDLSASSSPFGAAQSFVTIAPKIVMFVSRVEGFGIELVIADIPNESFSVVDVEAGGSSASPESLLVVESSVYFTARSFTSGRELYRYDINAESFSMVKDINTGSGGGLDSDAQLIALGTRVFFAADDGISGVELWSSKGHSISTAREADIAIGASSSSPQHFVVVDGNLVYQADDGRNGTELWTTSESSVTRPLAHLASGSASSEAQPLGALGSRVILRANVQGNSDRSLYSVAVDSSRRGVGAALLSPNVFSSGSVPRNISPILGGVAFTALTTAESSAALTYFPGNGAEPMGDLVSGDGYVTIPSRQDFLAIGDRVVFSNSHSSRPQEAYVWDGSDVHLVEMLVGDESRPTGPMASVGGRALVRAKNASDGRSVWSINPVTLSFEELPVDGVPLAAGDVALIVDDDTLYKTDGTAAGTSLIGVLPDNVKSYNGLLVSVLQEASEAQMMRVVFLLDDESFAVTDGTPAGTFTFAPPLGTDFSTAGFVASGGRAMVVMSIDGSYELVVTDGTEAGTSVASDRGSDPTVDVTFPHLRGPVAGGWIFSDSRTTTGFEPWFSNGIDAPVVLDIWPGPSHSFPGQATAFGDRLIFSAQTSTTGTEFWITDGTAEGSAMLGEVHPGAAGMGLLISQASSGSIFYFSAVGPEGAGRELWAWEEPLFADGFESGSLGAWSP